MKVWSRGIYSSSSIEGFVCMFLYFELLIVVKFEVIVVVFVNKVLWFGLVCVVEVKS